MFSSNSSSFKIWLNPRISAPTRGCVMMMSISVGFGVWNMNHLDHSEEWHNSPMILLIYTHKAKEASKSWHFADFFGGPSSCSILLGSLQSIKHTVESEKWWLGDYFPFGKAYSCVMARMNEDWISSPSNLLLDSFWSTWFIQSLKNKSLNSKKYPPGKLRWQWKIHHEWRCMCYWKCGFSNVMLVVRGVSWYTWTKPVNHPPTSNRQFRRMENPTKRGNFSEAPYMSAIHHPFVG